MFCPARTGCTEADGDLLGQRTDGVNSLVQYTWNKKVNFCCLQLAPCEALVLAR